MKNTRKEFLEADRETKMALTPLQERIRKALRASSGRYSDHVIAARVGTSHVTVGKVRKMFPQYNCAKTIADDFRDMMRLAVIEAGFGFSWEHHPGLHTAQFFCPVCKPEFDCEVLS